MFASVAIDQLKRARRICLSFPEAVEKEAWGAPTFRIRNKIFATFDDHHVRGRIALVLAADFGVQEELMARQPDRYFVPPYVGHRGWIGIHLDKNDDKTVKLRVRESYELIAAKAGVKRASGKPRRA